MWKYAAVAAAGLVLALGTVGSAFALASQGRAPCAWAHLATQLGSPPRPAGVGSIWSVQVRTRDGRPVPVEGVIRFYPDGTYLYEQWSLGPGTEGRPFDAIKMSEHGVYTYDGATLTMCGPDGRPHSIACDGQHDEGQFELPQLPGYVIVCKRLAP